MSTLPRRHLWIATEGVQVPSAHQHLKIHFSQTQRQRSYTSEMQYDLPTNMQWLQGRVHWRNWEIIWSKVKGTSKHQQHNISYCRTHLHQRFSLVKITPKRGGSNKSLLSRRASLASTLSGPGTQSTTIYGFYHVTWHHMATEIPGSVTSTDWKKKACQMYASFYTEKGNYNKYNACVREYIS